MLDITNLPTAKALKVVIQLIETQPQLLGELIEKDHLLKFKKWLAADHRSAYHYKQVRPLLNRVLFALRARIIVDIAKGSDIELVYNDHQLAVEPVDFNDGDYLVTIANTETHFVVPLITYYGNNADPLSEVESLAAKYIGQYDAGILHLGYLENLYAIR